MAPDLDTKTGGKLFVFAVPNDARGGNRELTRRRQFATCDVDAEGRFRMTGLLSGCDYMLVWNEISAPRRRSSRSTTPSRCRSSRSKRPDLGDVRLTLENPAATKKAGDELKGISAANSSPHATATPGWLPSRQPITRHQ